MDLKKIIIIIFIFPILSFAQEGFDTISKIKLLDEVNVNALRANEKTPIAFTNLEKKVIKKRDLGQDMPYIINLTPSIVSNSDAGTGFGYTAFRLRGSDATRINVTINGIPINDSESQGVWWVNMPDFAASVENIQIQRGVGSSTNGASAFGGTINLQTNNFKKKAYVTTNNSVGSFCTLKNNIQFGTGLINERFVLDGRLSQIQSDGFIDRAKCNLNSYFLSAGYYTEQRMLKAIMFGGKERTYQAWYGVPFKYLQIDSLRSYNPYTYKNEVDNYAQFHYQLHYKEQITPTTNYSVAAHYTHGEGYYEQEKLNQQFIYYGLEDIIIGSDTISATNLIRRKWLDNDFGGITYSFDHAIQNFKLTLGGAINQYEGLHYGNIVWAQYSSNGNFNHQYYCNKAQKLDHNIYGKLYYEYSASTNIYMDLQRRRVKYIFEGYSENNELANQETALTFFNPKFGIHHAISEDQLIYASFAVGNKEPNRDDYVNSEFEGYPEHETLHDYEAGYKIQTKNSSFKANLYYMQYYNQLVPTGKINNVGANIRVNVENSFRRGLELEGKIKISRYLFWIGNLSLSENKIDYFSEYIDNWDTGTQEIVEYTNTDIAFSPKIIWMSQFDYQIRKNITLTFTSKYVGKQYIDNTSSSERMLSDYLISDIQINYKWGSKLFSESEIAFRINNLLDTEYESNAWVYRFISDNYDPRPQDPYVSESSERGYDMAAYFPQAGRNFLLSLTLGF